MSPLPEKNIHEIFIVSLILKGFFAVVEFIGGVLFLFTGTVTALIFSLIRGELTEDPTDFIATHILKYLPFLSAHAQLFGAFYLLSHAVVKLFLVISLLRGKIWAYPATIVVLILFIVYQLIRFAYTHSVFLIILTLFDLLIVLLTWHEFNIVKGHVQKTA